MEITTEDIINIITEETEQILTEKCWPGYEKKGMKKMFGKMYPNCVKKSKKKKNEEIEEEKNPRVPRKKGQPAKSDKHSDLYTDEDPKGTIHGLKFATTEDAEKSVNKIKKSGRSHAHKVQAAVAMEQRAKAAGKKSAAAVYRKYINSVKKDEDMDSMEITTEDIINTIEEEISRVLENDNGFLGDLEGWFDTKGRRDQYIKHFPNECAVYLTITPKGSEYYIDMIETIGEDCGRKGYASQVMNFITDAADTNRVSLTLDVASWPGGPDTYDLREWYKGYGFEDIDGHPSEPEMRREPRNSLDEKKKSKRKKAGTESSKEKSLHHWFKRKGAKGKKGGWVDCNAPDGKGGYKACGRGEGEKRKKYPACRPTPGACKERGRGKSWGKKAKKRSKKK